MPQMRTAPTEPTSTAPTPSALPGLARCVADVDGFLDRSWARWPSHAAGIDPSAFADLFSLDDVDRIITSSPRVPAFRLVRDGSPIDPKRYTRTATVGGRPVSGIGDAGRIFDELRAGATIVLQGLQRSHPPLTGFCRALELELSHSVQANAYVTPSGSRGLGVHYDTHDVFVLQLAGTKSWSVFEPVLTDPLPSQPWKGTAADAGTPCLSVVLGAGDCLYVPRGFLHSAEAQQDLSAHLTIGVVTTTWHDLLREVVATTADDPELRRAVPVGYAADPELLLAGLDDAVARLRKTLADVDTRAVAATTARRFLARRRPLLTGQLRQLGLLDRLTDESTLRRRQGSVCLLDLAGDTLVLTLGDRELHLPAALASAIDRVLGWGSAVFRVGDLADLVDRPSRIVLCRRLVAEGLLEILDLG